MHTSHIFIIYLESATILLVSCLTYDLLSLSRTLSALSDALWFLLYKPWTFIKFVPEYFILLAATGTEIAFLISFQTVHSQGVEIPLILYIDLVSLHLTKVAH